MVYCQVFLTILFCYIDKMLFRNYLTIAFGAALLFLTIGFSLYYVRLAHIENLIVVHFLARHGADFLGDKKDVLGMLTAGGIITIINIGLASALYNRRRIMAYYIGIITTFISFLILITVIAIISVN